MRKRTRAPVTFPGGRRITYGTLQGQPVATAWAVPFDRAATEPVPFLVSIEDVSRVEHLHLYENADGYAQAWFQGVAVSLHRIIARAPKGIIVDHRNRNRRDCRRGNLRWATRSLNSVNRTTRPHSSRYRGVTKHKLTGRWQAALKHRDKCHHLGLHDTEEAAAVAYNAKALEVWGEFAVLNAIPSKPASRRHAA